jgi:hypothetical protein
MDAHTGDGGLRARAHFTDGVRAAAEFQPSPQFPAWWHAQTSPTSPPCFAQRCGQNLLQVALGCQAIKERKWNLPSTNPVQVCLDRRQAIQVH